MLLMLTSWGCRQPVQEDNETDNTDEMYYSMEDFASVEKVNTHAHINREDTSYIHQAAANKFRLITVNVDPPDYKPIEEQQRIAVILKNAFPQRVAYATTFSLVGFNEAGWQEKTIEYLKASFEKGAIAVKVWKDIGMELKDKDGKFVQIDHPQFDPILDFIAENNITLIAHIGEPRNAWLPVAEMTVDGDKKYFSAYPEYHMYLHPEYPSHGEIIAARDRMLAKHPNLRVVGAHLASLEWDVDELAKRLDKYPNLAVDMAERISHLQYQAVTDWEKVHAFVIRYQDRLIYGNDESVSDGDQVEEVNAKAKQNWLRHWQYFVSADTMKVPKVEREFRALRLPREVVDKIFRRNAEKWFPGLKTTEGAGE
jgi:predicted TIM-barrel fold metal-dependent hydrolase